MQKIVLSPVGAQAIAAPALQRVDLVTSCDTPTWPRAFQIDSFQSILGAVRKRANITALCAASFMFWSVGCNSRTRQIGEFLHHVWLIGSVLMTLLGLFALYKVIQTRPSRAPGSELACALTSPLVFGILGLPSYFMIDLGLVDADNGTSVWLIVFDIFAGCVLLFIVFMIVWSLVAWVRRVGGSGS